MSTVANEISAFDGLINDLAAKFVIEEICSHAFILTPRGCPILSIPSKRVALTISAIVHGNETVGIVVVNELLRLLASGVVDCQIPLGVMLGNPRAALEDKRFLERDLNRSFASLGADTWEERRAHELEPLLRESAFLLDIHQTRRESRHPFFIFPYTEQAFEFAENISTSMAIATHWQGAFSKLGKCSDEYVTSQGGVAITIECGQAGFDSDQSSLALETVLQALHFVAGRMRGEKSSHLPHRSMQRRLFTFAAVIPCPQKGYLRLTPNLINFQRVSCGEELASCEAKKIQSPCPGWLLFPNYAAESSLPGSRPIELMRILRSIGYDELPVSVN